MFNAVYHKHTGDVAYWMTCDNVESVEMSMVRRLGADVDLYAIASSEEDFSNDDVRVSVEAETLAIVRYVPTKTDEELRAEILAATQRRLDEFAQTRNFDSILSAATYATSAVEQFAVEGQRAAELRDATWAALYSMLAEVLAGSRAMPSGFDDIEGELPVLTWSI